MKHWGSRPKIYDNDTRIIATWGQSRFFRKGGGIKNSLETIFSKKKYTITFGLPKAIFDLSAKTY